MLQIPWSQATGWQAPQIRPCTFGHLYLANRANKGMLDGPLALEPSCTVLHYAQTLFEGMKAYRDEKGKVTLFRPDMNMKRMNRSAARIALPVSLSFAHVHRGPIVDRRSTEMLYWTVSRLSFEWTRIGFHKKRDTVFISDRHLVRTLSSSSLV
jgi:branched-subunit amino acid aminotransferase/4-amino-4-deoxychorismate lyase